jgi:hypothetical protein
MGGSNDKYTGEEKFLLVFDGEAWRKETISWT